MFIQLFAWLAGLARCSSRPQPPFDRWWRMVNYLIGFFLYCLLACFLVWLSIYLEVRTQATAGDMTRLQTGAPLLFAALLLAFGMCEVCCMSSKFKHLLDTHRNQAVLLESQHGSSSHEHTLGADVLGAGQS